MGLHDLVLEHYTAEPLTFDRTRTYEQRPLRSFGKPTGFWVSVAGEDDWPAWCRAEEFCVGSLANCVRVTLVEDARIRLVSSSGELDAFHDEFCVDDPDSLLPPDFLSGLGRPQFFRPVDWSVVADRYQGVMFAPYLWARRFDGPNFYYGLDCASGCIWDLSAIADVAPVLQSATGSEVMCDDA